MQQETHPDLKKVELIELRRRDMEACIRRHIPTFRVYLICRTPEPIFSSVDLFQAAKVSNLPSFSFIIIFSFLLLSLHYLI